MFPVDNRYRKRTVRKTVAASPRQAIRRDATATDSAVASNYSQQGTRVKTDDCRSSPGCSSRAVAESKQCLERKKKELAQLRDVKEVAESLLISPIEFSSEKQKRLAKSIKRLQQQREAAGRDAATPSKTRHERSDSSSPFSQTWPGDDRAIRSPTFGSPSLPPSPRGGSPQLPFQREILRGTQFQLGRYHSAARKPKKPVDLTEANELFKEIKRQYVKSNVNRVIAEQASRAREPQVKPFREKKNSRLFEQMFPDLVQEQCVVGDLLSSAKKSPLGAPTERSKPDEAQAFNLPNFPRRAEPEENTTRGIVASGNEAPAHKSERLAFFPNGLDEPRGVDLFNNEVMRAAHSGTQPPTSLPPPQSQQPFPSFPPAQTITGDMNLHAHRRVSMSNGAESFAVNEPSNRQIISSTNVMPMNSHQRIVYQPPHGDIPVLSIDTCDDVPQTPPTAKELVLPLGRADRASQHDERIEPLHIHHSIGGRQQLTDFTTVEEDENRSSSIVAATERPLEASLGLSSRYSQPDDRPRTSPIAIDPLSPVASFYDSAVGDLPPASHHVAVATEVRKASPINTQRPVVLSRVSTVNIAVVSQGDDDAPLPTKPPPHSPGGRSGSRRSSEVRELNLSPSPYWRGAYRDNHIRLSSSFLSDSVVSHITPTHVTPAESPIDVVVGKFRQAQPVPPLSEPVSPGSVRCEISVLSVSQRHEHERRLDRRSTQENGNDDDHHNTGRRDSLEACGHLGSMGEQHDSPVAPGDEELVSIQRPSRLSLTIRPNAIDESLAYSESLNLSDDDSPSATTLRSLRSPPRGLIDSALPSSGNGRRPEEDNNYNKTVRGTGNKPPTVQIEVEVVQRGTAPKIGRGSEEEITIRPSSVDLPHLSEQRADESEAGDTSGRKCELERRRLANRNARRDNKISHDAHTHRNTVSQGGNGHKGTFPTNQARRASKGERPRAASTEPSVRETHPTSKTRKTIGSALHLREKATSLATNAAGKGERRVETGTPQKRKARSKRKSVQVQIMACQRRGFAERQEKGRQMREWLAAEMAKAKQSKFSRSKPSSVADSNVELPQNSVEVGDAQ